MSESITNSEDLNSLSVSTDQLDYAPGSTVNITLTGLAPGASATFQIADLESDPGDDGDADTYQPFTVTDGGEGDLDGVANGVILTSWTVPTTGDPDNATLSLTATSGDRTATTTFTDAVAKDYQHWSDTGTPDWEGNVLNDPKSDYFEGEIIPHVYVIEDKDLTPGQSYSFTITYNYYQQNTDANGFGAIATYNVDRNATPISGGTGVTPSASGPALPGGGSFYTNNAIITNISAPVTTGTGNLDQTVTVTFTYTGPATNEIAEFYFGLQVAPSGNGNNGASAWTGGSLQTTISSQFSGNVSLQLAPDAIIRGTISGVKFEDANGNGIQDDGELGLAGWTIFLDKDGDDLLDAGEVSTLTASDGSYSFTVTPDADPSDVDNDPYIVREVNQPGWTQTSTNPLPVLISAADPTQTDVNFGNQEQVRSLEIQKDADKTTVSTAGETITYTMLVSNTGNAAIANVTVTDPTLDNEAPVLDGDGFNVGDTDEDDLLDVGETWEFTGTREVSQDELDAGADLVNTATADGDDVDPDDDDATVTIDQNPAIDIEKYVSINGGAWIDADSPTGPAAPQGATIQYKFVVVNTGNVTLTNVVVSDPSLDLNGALAGTTWNVGQLDVDETANELIVNGTWQAGQHTNTGTATSAENATDSDNANYYGEVEGPGVRTPGFWSNLGLKFWDGVVGNEPKSGPGFPDGELAWDPDVPRKKDGDEYILLGDQNGNGIDDGASENTLRIKVSDAQAILNASQKQLQDARWVLARDAIATQLNLDAGNPVGDGSPGTPLYYLNESVDWLNKTTNGDGVLTLSELNSGKVATSSNAWQKGIDGPDAGTVIGNSITDIDAGSALHNALDSYNNTGAISGNTFANDGDFTSSTTYQTAMQTYLQSLLTTV